MTFDYQEFTNTLRRHVTGLPEIYALQTADTPLNVLCFIDTKLVEHYNFTQRTSSGFNNPGKCRGPLPRSKRFDCAPTGKPTLTLTSGVFYINALLRS